MTEASWEGKTPIGEKVGGSGWDSKGEQNPERKKTHLARWEDASQSLPDEKKKKGEENPLPGLGAEREDVPMGGPPSDGNCIRKSGKKSMRVKEKALCSNKKKKKKKGPSSQPGGETAPLVRNKEMIFGKKKRSNHWGKKGERAWSTEGGG